MSILPHRASFLTRLKDQGFSGAFLAIVLLAVVAWVYLLGTLFMKLLLWSLS